ncbi:MAG TPA: lipid-binding SYLF domain-containing protein [Gammaproteobacteria bacterium]
MRTPARAVCGFLLLLAWAGGAAAQTSDAERLALAAEVLSSFTRDEENGIPIQLLQEARGIAVVPNLIRGGFIFGGRRGRGVLVIRTEDGRWSNPAFITVTGGSVGAQFGVESMDLVLVFANDRSIRNIEDGRFTLGGEASALAGPMGKRSAAVVTARSEVYAYIRSRGLFAGAAFEGARLDVDEEAGDLFYSGSALPLHVQTESTPESARRFLAVLEAASRPPPAPGGSAPPARADESQEAIIYPLETAR